MTAKNSATAGRGQIGKLELERAWRELARSLPDWESLPAPPEPLQLDLLPPPNASVEASQYHGPERGRIETDGEPFHHAGGFYSGTGTVPLSPIHALAQRLNEFASGAAESYGAKPAEARPTYGRQYYYSRPDYANDELSWFDGRFAELRQLVSDRHADKSEFALINARLAEIMDRVDRLSKSMPSDGGFRSIEDQLASLARTFDVMLSSNAAQSKKLDSAAQTMFKAANTVEETASSFTQQAAKAFDEFRKSRREFSAGIAKVTAEQVTAALNTAIPAGHFQRVESEIRLLNKQSREQGNRAADSLDRVHETLKEYLRRMDDRNGQASKPYSAAKRMSVHMPIKADSQAFSRQAMHEKAPASGGRPVLSHLTERNEAKTAATPFLSTGGNSFTNDTGNSPIPSILRRREEEERVKSGHEQRVKRHESWHKHTPVAGVIAVALILFMAAGGLLYLHLFSKPESPLLPWPAVQNRVSPMSALPQGEPRNPGAMTLRQGLLESPEPDHANDGKPERGTVTKPQDGEAAEPQRQSLRQDFMPLIPSLHSSTEAEGGIQKLAEAAALGDMDAQYRVGLRFLGDKSVRSNAASALRWLKRAAEQGHTEAQFMLATLFETGTGGARDEAKAIEFYTRAASLNHIKAMHNLGVMLAARRNPQAYDESFGWFSKAAAMGLADSQFNLALMYERGLGAGKNLSKAYFWYVVAAQAGDKEAEAKAQRLKQTLPAAEVRRLETEAANWSPSSLEARQVSHRRG